MVENIPDMEKIVGGEALKQSIESVRLNIERQRGDMAQSTTNAAGEVGLIKSLWNVMQERQGKNRELAWKDLKATAAGALAAIPIVGEAGTLVKLGSAAGAGKNALSAEKAVWSSRSALEGTKSIARLSRDRARRDLWGALKDVPSNPVRLVSEPIKSGKEAWKARGALRKLETTPVVVHGADTNPIAAANKVVLEGIKMGKLTDAKTTYSAAKRQLGKDALISGGLHLMHKIDPFPDVPPALIKVAGLADLVLPGVNIAPALWQLGHNRIEWIKMYGGMALDMGKVVMSRLDKKLTGMKEPQVARAAAVFHHG